MLVAAGALTDNEADAITAEEARRIEDAVAAAEAAPLAPPEEAFDDVYA